MQLQVQQLVQRLEDDHNTVARGADSHSGYVLASRHLKKPLLSLCDDPACSEPTLDQIMLSYLIAAKHTLILLAAVTYAQPPARCTCRR